ncbi:MAG: hypothetical protein QM802_11400 [Agriterribacter sp.]
MKYYFFVFFLTISCQLQAQPDSADKAFIENKIRWIQPENIAYYSNTPQMKLYKAALERLPKGTIINYKGDTLTLTKHERSMILRRLRQFENSELPDSIFENCKRINRDEIVKLVQEKNKAWVDSVVHGLKKRDNYTRLYWAFSFTFPIYFRQNNWMIYYFMYYENSSGAESLSINKKVDGKWETWYPISGGAW